MPAPTPVHAQRQAVDLYQQGSTYAECAAAVGIGEAAVLNAVWRAGLRGRDTRFVKQHTTNHQFFQTWTPRMAWVLGYLCADGCVLPRRLSFACAVDDRELIDAVKSATETSHPISVNPQRKNGFGTKDMCRLVIGSAQMVADLAAMHSVLPRKSSGNPPMPSVPDEYLGDFFRGVFDGDGCFHRRPCKTFQAVVTVAGTELFLNQLADRMHAIYGLTRPPVAFHKTVHAVQWTGKKSMQVIHAAMYQSDDIHCCSRKKSRFDAAIAAMPATHCRVDSKTGYRGVRPAGANRFAAFVRFGGRFVGVGTYDTAGQAAVAHNAAITTLTGNPGTNPTVVTKEVVAAITENVRQRLGRKGLL